MASSISMELKSEMRVVKKKYRKENDGQMENVICDRKESAFFSLDFSFLFFFSFFFFFFLFLFLFSSSTHNHVHTFSSFLFLSYFAHSRPPLCPHTHAHTHTHTHTVCGITSHSALSKRRTECVLTPQTQTQTHRA